MRTRPALLLLSAFLFCLLASGAEPEPGAKAITLMLGKADTERKGVYAKRGDAARVFLLPQDLWDNLPKTATAVRDKTLLKYEREHVTRLEMQSPGEHIVITAR